MHFELSPAICCNFNQSKVLSSGNGLKHLKIERKDSVSVFTNHSQEQSLSFSSRFVRLNVTQLLLAEPLGMLHAAQSYSTLSDIGNFVALTSFRVKVAPQHLHWTDSISPGPCVLLIWRLGLYSHSMID